jgi:hypothetical protein
VELEPISESALSTPLTFDREGCLQELIAGCLKGTLSVTVASEAEGEEEVLLPGKVRLTEAWFTSSLAQTRR